jgi:hypothetical protein
VVRAGFEAGRSWREIWEGLPGRTFIAIKNRGQKLGLKQCPAGIPWTAEEDATLRAGFEAGESWKAIAEQLPRRSTDLVRRRGLLLGLERGEKRVLVAWTEAEDEEIRAGVAAGETDEELAKRLPGRSQCAVEKRRLMLTGSEHPAERWTKAEDAALREGLASGKSWKEIAKEFPGRTRRAAEMRANRLRQKRDESDGAV